ncbi:conserved hypothetical protein [Acinetobacter proteolyticus]|uniref:Uncharacterized protein n=1 Tax=Acinetobacter proteolyticus TaxID=1776741 RepID=A0A653KCK9_9GAMM|nr:hypothetical protein [Acinetobacter proteolyticus]VXA58239.1 conserved hypothetical protein [Acinetobacter proteolyticus]
MIEKFADEIQSWIAVKSFSAANADYALPVVDANELAAFITDLVIDTNQLKPCEIKRDKYGSWIHPVYLKYIQDHFGNSEWISQEQYDALKKHFNIVTTRIYLEGSVSEDLYKEISQSSDLTKWDPIAPHGYFLIQIGQDDDDTFALFAKQIERLNDKSPY